MDAQPEIQADLCKLKIAFLSTMPLAGIGGTQVFLYNLSQNMSVRGHDVHIHNWLPYKRSLRNAKFYFNLPVKIYPFPPGMGRAFNRFPPLAKRYVRTLQAIHRYDAWIIIGAYPDAYIASSLAGRAPLILRTYGRDIQVDNEIGHGNRRDPKVDDRTIYAINKMDRVIAMTKTIHAEYLDMGVPESNIVDIPNGVDVSRFQAADVFVFPSKLELFPQVVIQAMAASLPVVTTDAPGCGDVTEHNVNGLIASPDSIEQFANHISLIIDNQTLRNQLIEGGLRKARESDWPCIASAYEDVCWSLVAES